MCLPPLAGVSRRLKWPKPTGAADAAAQAAATAETWAQMQDVPGCSEPQVPPKQQQQQPLEPCFASPSLDFWVARKAQASQPAPTQQLLRKPSRGRMSAIALNTSYLFQDQASLALNGSWEATSQAQNSSAYPPAVQSLFSIEGQEALQEMWSSVVGGNDEQAPSWQRVMRVPVNGAKPAADFCWQQVYICTTMDPEHGRMLLVHQVDVLPEQVPQVPTPSKAAERAQPAEVQAPKTEADLSFKASSAGSIRRCRPSSGDMIASFVVVDIANYTSLSTPLDAGAMAALMDSVSATFTDLCATYGIQRMKVPGQSRLFIACANKLSNDAEAAAVVDAHAGAAKLVKFAQDLQAATKKVLVLKDTYTVQLRCGIHSGPWSRADVTSNEVASTSGLFRVAKVATSVQRSCPAGRIQVSSSTRALLLAGGLTTMQDWQAGAGTADLKGISVSPINTFVLVTPKDASDARSSGSNGAMASSRPSSATAASLSAMGKLLTMVDSYRSPQNGLCRSASNDDFASRRAAGQDLLSLLGNATAKDNSSGFVPIRTALSTTSTANIMPGWKLDQVPTAAFCQDSAKRKRNPFANFSSVLMEVLNGTQVKTNPMLTRPSTSNHHTVAAGAEVHSTA